MAIQRGSADAGKLIISGLGIKKKKKSVAVTGRACKNHADSSHLNTFCTRIIHIYR